MRETLPILFLGLAFALCLGGGIFWATDGQEERWRLERTQATENCASACDTMRSEMISVVREGGHWSCSCYNSVTDTLRTIDMEP